VTSADDRSDQRTLLIALSVMLALVLVGVAFGSGFAGTRCRELREVAVAPATVLPAEDRAAILATGAAGLDAATLASLEGLLGPVDRAVSLPSGVHRAVVGHPEGVLVTGAAAALVLDAGTVATTVGVRGEALFVGDGIAVYALVVGNALTGQVDALRPIRLLSTGTEAGTCVDTSAVGSPLSFVHDASDGVMLGLRTDEDGTDAVFELRDQVRGRIWAPPVTVGLAPAGLLGARTSAAIGPDRIVLARRLADPATAATPAAERAERESVVRILARRDGTLLHEVAPEDLRAALAATPGLAELAALATLRLEVAAVDETHAVLDVRPDVGTSDPLVPPRHGPFAGLVPVEAAAPDPLSAVVTIVLDGGRITDVVAGAAPTSRAGAEAAGLRDRVRAVAPQALAVHARGDAVWVLFDGLLLRLAP
jgi:hypothetical protein